MKRRRLTPKLLRSGQGSLLAAFVLLLLPSLLLHRALFLGEDFVPFDLTTFAPASVGLEPEEIAHRRQGGNYDITEKLSICVPEYQLARTELSEGRFPHWNPYVRAGAPLFANALDGFAYPPHWLFFALQPERAFGFVAWFAFALAGLFMFGFLREVGLRVLPSLFGAVVFQMSGTLAANAHFFMRMETLVWLPAGFWALERIFKQAGVRRIPAVCAFALSLGLCWLAGFPPYALACSLAFGLYVVALGLRTWRMSGVKPAAGMVAWSGLGILCGIAIAAIQLLPMIDYFPEAQRELTQDAAGLAAQGFDPAGLLGYVMPAPFGHPTETSVLPYAHNPLLYLVYSRADPQTGRLFFPINFVYTEYAVYLGAIPLLCIVLGLLKGSVRFLWFALPTLVFFLALATGDGVFRLLGWIPVLQSSPPMRFVAVACFFGAALAAMGLDVAPAPGRLRRWAAVGVGGLMVGLCLLCQITSEGMLRDLEGTKQTLVREIGARWSSSYPEVASDPDVVLRWIGPYTEAALDRFSSQALYGAIAFLLATAWLVFLPGLGMRGAWRRRAQSLLVGSAVALTALELLLLAMPVNPTFPRREPSDTPVHRFLREQRLGHRAEGGFTVARVAREVQEPVAFPPNLLIPEQIRDLNCYAFVDRRSHLPFRQLYGPDQMIRDYWLKALPADARLDLPIFDLFGVRYLLTTEEIPRLGKPATPPYEGPGGAFWIYEREKALPRAFLVPEAVPVATDGEAVDRLIAADFDPRARVLLHDVAEGSELQRTADPSRLAQATVRFTLDHPQEIEILVRDSPGAWLVLTDSAMSHWAATLNGGDIEWHRANLCFRAVWIPAGDHELRFTYHAASFLSGLIVTSITLGALLILLLWWNGHPDKRAPDVDVVEMAS